MIEQAIAAFIKVRDSLNSVKHQKAYRISFSKPLLFYIEHTKEEAIVILTNESEEC